tara:strand:+ start:63 stop:1013 length:951 start_codon:yes stop_codon:yes gene_type:complete
MSVKKIYSKEEVMRAVEDNKALVTSCDGCVFASENDITNENLDDYCSAGRLSKFNEVGAEIISIESRQKNKNFKLIKDNICNMLRGKPWDDIKLQKGYTQEELVGVARKEVSIKCTYLIYFDNDEAIKNENDESLKRKIIKDKLLCIAKTIKSAEKGILKPENVVVINNSVIGPYDFINYLRRFISELKINLKWSMEHISDDSIRALDDKEEAMHRCVDLASKSIKSIHCSIFVAGDDIPTNYLSDIDSAINDDLEKFLILKPEDGKKSGMFVQKLAYKQFGGNKQKEFISKIEEEAEFQKCPHLIQSLSKVVKSQ